MPDRQREEIIDIVKEAIKSEIDARIVRALVWIIGVGLANFAAIVTGVWMFWTVSQRVEDSRDIAIHDRWTGTMAVMAEYERKNLTTGYVPVDILEIQKKYPPQ